MLVLSPAGERPSPENLQRLEREYSLREALNTEWAIRPLAIGSHSDTLYQMFTGTLPFTASDPLERTEHTNDIPAEFGPFLMDKPTFLKGPSFENA